MIPDSEGVPSILVVDDQPSTRTVLQRAARLAGAEASCAANLSEAAALIEQHAFACAFVDKNLPDGTGLSLLQQLRSAASATEVVIVTGHADLQSAVEALKLGARDYIVKPFDLHLIIHRIQSLLEHQRVVRERAALEESLVVAEQLANVGLLASGIGKEMADPLTRLLGNVELARVLLRRFRAGGAGSNLPPVSPHAVDDALLEVLKGAEQMSDVLTDLRRLSAHSESAPSAPVDVRLVLDAMAKFVRPELARRARLVRDFEAVPFVEGDQGRLGQVFLNLLSNAALAIAPGRPDENEVRVVTRLKDDKVVVEVTDSGDAVAIEQRKESFRPFFGAHGGVRSGKLGLAICRRIILEHHGSLDLECDPARGSTFRVMLPAGNAARLFRRA